MHMNRTRSKVLSACLERRSSTEIAKITGVDVIYVRTILRDFKNNHIVDVYKEQLTAGNTGYSYKVKNADIVDKLTKDHEPRPLMNVLGVWI